MHAVLKREGQAVGRKRVERLMREAGLHGVSPRCHGKGFTRRAPDAAVTVIATDEGPLWLSAIRDAFSRRVVAWETSARADADLVWSSLEYAPLAGREIEPGILIHHADHGCQYTAIKLTTRLVRAGIQC
ncbi:transposase [Streptomyces sp. NPDC048362]|uniref:transposase n=1 Tax=Streptomyces sp. NPDC048362 TaxID=3365539 RepID=UPI00371081BE